MAQDMIPVGVVVVKRRLKGPWASHAWAPLAVLPAIPAAEPGARLGTEGDDEAFYAGPAELTLHSADTGFYRDNLSAAQPSLWVALRPAGDGCEVSAVTADPYEGEALACSVDEIVDAVPMPDEIRERVAAFFAAFHVERVFHKRKRDRVDPDRRGRGAPVGGEGQE